MAKVGMNDNDIEKLIFASGFFFAKCEKCVNRKVGCAKDCKFYKAYKRRAKIEQR